MPKAQQPQPQPRSPSSSSSSPPTLFAAALTLFRLFFLCSTAAAMSSPSSSSPYRLKGKLVCLVGASSGIGQSIAEALYREGANVAIGARRLDKLNEVAVGCKTKYPSSPGDVFPVECDVTVRSSVFAFVESAKTYYQSDASVSSTSTSAVDVDVMICCAGVMYFTKMKNANMDDWDRTIDVNCRGTTNCIGAVLPSMVEGGKGGKIVTISSDAGVRDFPNLAVYCASKRFVETLTEITRRELVGTGVTLHTIQPGDVKGTELIMKNNDAEAADAMGVAIGQPVGEGFTREQLLDPEDVADAVITVLTALPHVAINSILIEPRDQT